MARQRKATEMATDVSEIETTEDVESTTEASTEKRKRERVQLETLDAGERVQQTFALPAGMKLALEKLAESESLSPSAYVRKMVATQIEYVIPASFDERTREAKYNSEEDKKAAQKTRNDERREFAKMLMAAAKADPELLARARAAMATQNGNA